MNKLNSFPTIVASIFFSIAVYVLYALLFQLIFNYTLSDLLWGAKLSLLQSLGILALGNLLKR